MRSKQDLKDLQALPLDLKILLTKQRIRDWVNWWGSDGVYVSFSGGKDSTVMLDLVRQEYPDVEAVFVNTGIEYPEIQQFVKTFDNVTILRPKMRFDEIIRKYGYPVISKRVSNVVRGARKNLQDGKTDTWRMKRIRGELLGKDGKKSLFNEKRYEPLLYTDFEISDYCCDIMKKHTAKQYQKTTNKNPIISTITEESELRELSWLKNGCNAFDSPSPKSTPLSFWTEQDILQYIKENNLKIASVYGDIVEKDCYGFEYSTNLLGEKVGKLYTTGCNRTGCIFCGFGCHLDKTPSRFQRLKQTHPRQYEYCIGGGEYDEDGIWKPNKQGLGMGHVFDELNRIYGDGFIKY